jgi:chromodomain-helicase-DNA-binding protein 7
LTLKINKVPDSLKDQLCTKFGQNPLKDVDSSVHKDGAYGALMEDDKAGDDFCEEDIDQILQRRTQVIQIESEGKGSTFAKVTTGLLSRTLTFDI